MTEFEKLQQQMSGLANVPANPTPSKPGEYSGRDGVDGMTLNEADPALDTRGAPVAPPVTAAERGKVLPGTAPLEPSPFAVHNAMKIMAGQLPGISSLGDPGVISDSPVAAPAVKLVFTGASGSGKTTIAKQLGLEEIRIDQDIVDLYRRYFPGQEPPADFVNTLLVWGEGAIDPKSPVTPARLLFVDFYRTANQQDQSANVIFGQPGYWQNALLRRAANATGGVAITTCTTQAILNELKSQGFAHFHIACSNQTLAARKRRQGANDTLASAFSNQLVREVSMRPQGPALPCIWNDTVPAPSPRFLTLETARQVIAQSQQQVITGE